MSIPILDSIIGADTQQIIQLCFTKSQCISNSKDIFPISWQVFITKPVFNFSCRRLGIDIRHIRQKKICQPCLQIISCIHLMKDIAESTDRQLVVLKVRNGHGRGHLSIQDTVVFCGGSNGKLSVHMLPSFKV